MFPYFLFWGASLAWACIARSRLAQFAFVCATFGFVGLRFETGFDWPVFNYGFEVLQSDFSLELARWFSELFQIELGYVLLVAVAGQIFPTYEYFQALVTFVFLASVWVLCRAFGVRNVALVIAIAATFILLTLMMSTVRQCLAVSLFNFALAAAVARRRVAMIILLAAATTIHISTLFYVAALLFALVRPLQAPSPRTVILLVAAGYAVAISMGVIADFLPAFIANRVVFYRLDQLVEALSLWQLYFLILAIFITSYTMFSGPISGTPDARSTLLRRVIIALAVMCMCTLSLNVVRDRISYEMFLLFALYLAHQNLRLAIPARVAASVFGLFFSIFNILAPGNRIVFIPYQNAIGVAISGDEGDGQFRQDQFQQDFGRDHQQ